MELHSITTDWDSYTWRKLWYEQEWTKAWLSSYNLPKFCNQLPQSRYSSVAILYLDLFLTICKWNVRTISCTVHPGNFSVGFRELDRIYIFGWYCLIWTFLFIEGQDIFTILTRKNRLKYFELDYIQQYFRENSNKMQTTVSGQQTHVAVSWWIRKGRKVHIKQELLLCKTQLLNPTVVALWHKQ